MDHVLNEAERWFHNCTQGKLKTRTLEVPQAHGHTQMYIFRHGNLPSYVWGGGGGGEGGVKKEEADFGWGGGGGGRGGQKRS